jgi:IS30 family transposase
VIPFVACHRLEKAITQMPAELFRTLTWDRGKEMARHAQIKVAIGVQVYFCDPHAPWQRGSNENTNGLLRQFLPKGTDLSRHSAEELSRNAAEQPSSQDARLHETIGAARRTRCDDWLNPPN